MNFNDIIKRLILRGTTTSAAYRRLNLLYRFTDPWNMSSPAEQHRFVETTNLIKGIAPHYESVLELGSGEGHQSALLLDVADNVTGIELSERAVERARSRCPSAVFKVGRLEDVAQITGPSRFDLITACEVLYYLSSADELVASLKSRCNYLFVSNYKERAASLRSLFSGEGWSKLPDITFGDVTWECAYWDRSKALPARESDGSDPSRDPPSRNASRRGGEPGAP